MGTALPFRDRPWEDPDRDCPRCTKEDYGRGRLNLLGASRLVDTLCKTEEGPGYLHAESVGGSDLTTEEVEEFTLPSGAKWHVYRVTAEVAIPFNAQPDMPAYVAWPNPVRNRDGETTRTLLNYGGNLLKVGLVDTDVPITDCQMLLDGPVARLTGYNFARELPGGGLDYLVEPDSLRMAYTYWAVPPYAIDGILGPSIHPFQNPVEDDGGEFSFTIGREGFVRLVLIDVSGRVVRTLREERLPAGLHHSLLIGREGRALAPGVYWLRLSLDGAVATKKLVVLE
jgi:hypothetical protein